MFNIMAQPEFETVFMVTYQFLSKICIIMYVCHNMDSTTLKVAYVCPYPGNTNLIYSIIRSKAVFYQLANLPEDSYQLVKSHSGGVAGEKEEGEAGGGGELTGPPQGMYVCTVKMI